MDNNKKWCISIYISELYSKAKRQFSCLFKLLITLISYGLLFISLLALLFRVLKENFGLLLNSYNIIVIEIFTGS